MYTDDDLYLAVKQGIFTESDVDQFRTFITTSADTKAVDEENFRLLSGFNDIFVSISAFILLLSAGWLFGMAAPAVGLFVTALLSWGLSVFFVQKRKLALPAILFLMSFVASVAIGTAVTLGAMGAGEDLSLLVASAAGALAAWGHWRQFHVPITVAAGVASLIACFMLLLLQMDVMKGFVNIIAFGCGIITFIVAMAWDAGDTARKTRKSDVAFWLHLLAAPLIVHPVFMSFGIFDGKSGAFGITAIIVIYVLLAMVSIATDRRALMVSAMVYVLYAFRELFASYGMVSSSLAISGVFIGSFLLLLSAFWHRSRQALLKKVPESFARYLPVID